MTVNQQREEYLLIIIIIYDLSTFYLFNDVNSNFRILNWKKDSRSVVVHKLPQLF